MLATIWRTGMESPMAQRACTRQVPRPGQGSRSESSRSSTSIVLRHRVRRHRRRSGRRAHAAPTDPRPGSSAVMGSRPAPRPPRGRSARRPPPFAAQRRRGARATPRRTSGLFAALGEDLVSHVPDDDPRRGVPARAGERSDASHARCAGSTRSTTPSSCCSRTPATGSVMPTPDAIDRILGSSPGTSHVRTDNSRLIPRCCSASRAVASQVEPTVEPVPRWVPTPRTCRADARASERASSPAQRRARGL